MKRILLVRWGGLGDLLVALPSIRLLRHGFPDASLTLVGRPEYASLLLQARVIDQVVGIDDARVLSLFSDAAAAGAERTLWLDRFDTVLSWMNQKKSGGSGLGHGREEEEGRRLAIHYDGRGREPMSRFFYRMTLERLGSSLRRRAEFEDCARLPVSEIPEGADVDLPRRRAPSRPLAVIHPGSGGEKKRWPLANFLDIAKRLGERNIEVFFVTGEAEAALEGSIERAARSLGWPWLKSPSLASLARLLAKANLYLGNDSGVTHLAAACGARVLAFFRNDLIDIWRPFGDSHVLRADSVDTISLESAWNAAAELLCN